MPAAITANLLAAVDPPLNTPATVPTSALDAPLSSFSSVLTQIQSQKANVTPTEGTPAETESQPVVEADFELIESIPSEDLTNPADATNVFAASLVAASFIVPVVQPLTTEPQQVTEPTPAPVERSTANTQSRVEQLRFLQVPGTQTATVTRSTAPQVAATSDVSQEFGVTPSTTLSDPPRTTNVTLPTSVVAPTNTTTANTTAELTRAVDSRPSVLPQATTRVDPNPTLPTALPNIGYGNIRPNVSGPTEIAGPPAVNPGRGPVNDIPTVAPSGTPATNNTQPVAFGRVVEAVVREGSSGIVPNRDVLPAPVSTATRATPATPATPVAAQPTVRTVPAELPAPTVELANLPPLPAPTVTEPATEAVQFPRPAPAVATLTAPPPPSVGRSPVVQLPTDATVSSQPLVRNTELPTVATVATPATPVTNDATPATKYTLPGAVIHYGRPWTRGETVPQAATVATTATAPTPATTSTATTVTPPQSTPSNVTPPASTVSATNMLANTKQSPAQTAVPIESKIVVPPAQLPSPGRTTLSPTSATVPFSTTGDTQAIRLTPRAIGSVVQSEATITDRDLLATSSASVPTLATLDPIASPVPTATAPSTPSPIHEQLHDSIVTHAKLIETRPGEVEFQMHLDPKELGPIRVHLTATRSELRAEVVVADESVRKLVEQQLPELRQRLESSGVTVSRFDVTADQGGTSRGRDEGGSRQQYEPSSPPPRVPTPSPVTQRFQRPAPSRAGSLDVTA